MSIDIMKWVLVGILAAVIIIWSMVTFFKRKMAQINNEQDLNKSDKVTCESVNCGVWFSKTKRKDSKYCEFHEEVHKLYKTLLDNDSPHKGKANMYFTSDARALSDPQKHKMISELEKMVKEIKK